MISRASGSLLRSLNRLFALSSPDDEDWDEERDMMIPRSASVWCRRASIASMYPLGGPRLREGPRNVHAVPKRCVSDNDRRGREGRHIKY